MREIPQSQEEVTWSGFNGVESGTTGPERPRGSNFHLFDECRVTLCPSLLFSPTPFLYFSLDFTPHHRLSRSCRPASAAHFLQTDVTGDAAPAASPLSQPRCGRVDLKRLHLTHVPRYLLSLLPRNSPFELKPPPPLSPPRPLIFHSLPPADCHHRAGITPVSSHTSRHTGETCAGVKHGEGALLNLISQAGSH